MEILYTEGKQVPSLSHLNNIIANIIRQKGGDSYEDGSVLFRRLAIHPIRINGKFPSLGDFLQWTVERTTIKT